MFFAVLTLLVLDAGIGVLVFFAWRRVTAHLRRNPEMAKLLAQHVVVPMLFGEDEKESGKSEPKRIKGTLV